MISTSIKSQIRLIVLTLIIGLSSSCGKENLNPVFNDFPLIGTWISRDGRMVLNIKNLKNEGKPEDERYVEYVENGMRMLRRTYQSMPQNYQVVFIDGTELKLASKEGIIAFLRASK